MNRVNPTIAGHPYLFYPGFSSGIWGAQAFDWEIEDVEFPWVHRNNAQARAALSNYGRWQPPPTTISPNFDAWNYFDQHQAPHNAVEVVRWQETQRCIDIDPAELVETGVSFELARVRVQNATASILERIPTTMVVSALDDDGFVVLTYPFDMSNGVDPCREEFIHPDPAVLPLVWQYRIVATNLESALLPLATAVHPASIQGVDVLEPWSDLRYGTAARWGDFLRVVLPAPSLVRLWVTYFAEPDRYRVRSGVRLGGFAQACGRKASGLETVLRRF